MSLQPTYSINTDVKFRPLELIDVDKLAEACQEKWFNRTLCQVNDSVVRLGVVQGRLLIDLEGRTVELLPQQGLTVPRGVAHRTRAPERTVILMVEAATVTP